MNRRLGISPVVSVVLMVAVSISIGILVTTWVTHWVQQETSSEDITCAINTNYLIDNVKWNKTGYNSTLLLKVTNKGKLKLYGFSVSVSNGTVINDFNSSVVDQGGISETNKLDRERSVFLLVNLTDSSLNYPAFGRSLVGSDEAEVRVTNEACNAVSAETTTVS